MAARSSYIDSLNLNLQSAWSRAVISCTTSPVTQHLAPHSPQKWTATIKMTETYHKLQPELSTLWGQDAQCYRLASVFKIGFLSIPGSSEQSQAGNGCESRQGGSEADRPSQPAALGHLAHLPTFHSPRPFSCVSVCFLSPFYEMEQSQGSGR